MSSTTTAPTASDTVPTVVPALTPKRINEYKEALQKRLEILEEDLRQPQWGEGEEMIKVISNKAEEKKDIKDTLIRIDNNTFGICIDCKNTIPDSRLAVRPTAKRCGSCQSKHEASKPKVIAYNSHLPDFFSNSKRKERRRLNGVRF